MLLDGPQAGEALSALCACAKKADARAEINAALGDRRVLATLVLSPLPKVRKNVYRLVGALLTPADAELLIGALGREQTLYCVPSLLLALGALNQREALAAYTPPAPVSADTERQAADIRAALALALDRVSEDDAPPLTMLIKPQRIECRAPEGFSRYLADELSELGLSPVPNGDAVTVTTADIARVMRARCLREALLPTGGVVPLTAEAVARAACDCPGKRYRVELRASVPDRAVFIRKLCAAMGGSNSPSHYDCELRIEDARGGCRVYWMLKNVPDTRYPWRKETIAASMQPALGACLARLALARIGVERPRVLDPFCGSGTLLFSLEQQTRCAALIGVDQSADALEKAKRNAAAGNSRAVFVHKDCLKFRPDGRAFDLVIANLPFGNRVGTHTDNERLYAAFLRLLPELLGEHGVAVLYTMEQKLLSRLLKGAPALRVAGTFVTEAGGLLPRVFVIDKAEKC